MNTYISAYPNAFVIFISIRDIHDLLGPTKPPRTMESTFNVKQKSWNASRKIYHNFETHESLFLIKRQQLL